MMTSEEGDRRHVLDDYVMSGAVGALFVAVLFAVQLFDIPVIRVISEVLTFPGVVLSGYLFLADSNLGDLLLILAFALDALFWAWAVLQIRDYTRKGRSIWRGHR
jgi:hypothetical protein